ncbi:MAG TPA: nitronate monooxygenase family protein [Acetobacteraceae bacterium]|nr:nitronate monooxygenase family protein [Acetobacteraceae bacterium]
MALHSRICEMLGIRYPILLAGMGRASTPELAAAVSNAGGMGILGAASCGPNQLRAWIRRTRELTDKPFGVDTLLPASVRRGPKADNTGISPRDLLPQHRQFAKQFREREDLPELTDAEILQIGGRDPADLDGPALLTKEFFEAQMEVVIEERVALYAAGLGSPEQWMDRLKANGTKVLCVVGAKRHALNVVKTGVDMIVAQGHDGGGHNSPIGTMALIPQVVDAVAGRVPVIGAGGISDGRGVAAAMMLGAEGAWIGTAFLATVEAGLRDFQKQALVEGNDQSTVVSRSLTGKPARMVRNKWADAYTEAGVEPLPMPYQGMIAQPVTAAALRAGRADIIPGFAGQGLGMIKSVRPAAEVLTSIVAEAERVLARAGRFVAD